MPNNKNLYLDYNESDLVKAQDGDRIIVFKMMENFQKVEMIGQVKKPGTYNYYEGMNLFDLIELGGGFSDSTFWKSVYKSQAEIVRRDPSTRYETVIKLIYQGF